MFPTHRSVRTDTAPIRTLRLALAIALLCSAVAPVSAQVEETIDPGEFIIEGYRADCSEVTTIIRQSSEDLIYAPDGFTIIIDGPTYDTLTIGVRLFTYYQTCASMFYGDRLEFADRYAVRTGVERGWLTVADIEAICVANDLDGIWAANPGPDRCEIIRQAMIEALP